MPNAIREVETLSNHDLLILVRYGNNRRADLEARRRKLVVWDGR